MEFGPSALKEGGVGVELGIEPEMLTATYITYCLIVLLAVVWLGAMAVVVGACMSAARGDRALVAKRASDSSVRSAPAGMQLVA